MNATRPALLQGSTNGPVMLRYSLTLFCNGTAFWNSLFPYPTKLSRVGLQAGSHYGEASTLLHLALFYFFHYVISESVGIRAEQGLNSPGISNFWEKSSKFQQQAFPNLTLLEKVSSSSSLTRSSWEWARTHFFTCIGFMQSINTYSLTF